MPKFARSLSPFSVINQSGVFLCLFSMSGKKMQLDFDSIYNTVVLTLKNNVVNIEDAINMSNVGISKDTFYSRMNTEQRKEIRKLGFINKRERWFKDKTYLGRLCPYGHEYENTGMSLRFLSNASCAACSNQWKDRKKTPINNNQPKEEILLLFPIINDAHYLGRLCVRQHKYNGFNYSLRYVSNGACIYCHRDNMHLEKTENKLNLYMRNNIKRSLNDGKEGAHWEDIVGYTVHDLIRHIESQFNMFMSWSNYGSDWHIDHKKPKSMFHFKSMDDDEFKRCWSLDNLQPLEVVFNLQKGKKLFKKYAHL